VWLSLRFVQEFETFRPFSEQDEFLYFISCKFELMKKQDDLNLFQSFHCVGMQPVAAILCFMGTGCTVASTSSKHGPALTQELKFAKQRVKKFCRSNFDHHNAELLITI
jgi:hypothetical protein